MKLGKLISIATSSLLVCGALQATELASTTATDSTTSTNEVDIQRGWQMLGTSYDIANLDMVFGKAAVSTVWTYDTSEERWKVYSPSEDVRLQIMNSDAVAPLRELKVNNGYWVLANFEDTLELNATTNSELAVIAPPPAVDDGTVATTCTDSYYCFKDALTPVALTDLSGKTFKIVINDYQNADSYVSVTFASDGTASYDWSNAPDWMSSSTTTVAFNSTDGTIDVSNGYDSTPAQYKILASDTNGIIFGTTNLDGWLWNDLSYDSRTIIAVKDGVSTLTADMGSRIPYTVFNMWSDENYWTVYDNNVVTS